MKLRVLLSIILLCAVLATLIKILLQSPPLPAPDPAISDTELAYHPVTAGSNSESSSSEAAHTFAGGVHNGRIRASSAPQATDKLERLSATRESFQVLAAGDRSFAIHSAMQLPNETERETALMTLVTEWTHGELRPALERAHAIAAHGLETGLGLELAKNPELALLWANELTNSASRLAIVRETASTLLASDPNAAFAFSDQLPQEDRPKFLTGLYARWAEKDTEAALQWAEKLTDTRQQAEAMNAIRSVAPVGIGAALATQDGYPIVAQVLPGAPADLSGQLHKGDRILALAQSDNNFVDARNASLADIVQLVRGTPGSVVQLQILPANSPDAVPRTVSLVRQQIKYKQ